MSNNQNILNILNILLQLPETEILNKKATGEKSDQGSARKALGIFWNVKIDELRIKFSDKIFLNTIRGLLNLLCSTFDPFGIVSLCLIESKFIIQDLWKSKVDWEEE